MKKFTCLALSSALAAASAQKFSIDADTRTFRDEQGRARIFHGFNVVVKKPDYIPIQDHFDFDMSVSDEDLQYMQDWGTKIVRLGVMWESVEREAGVYDTAYLDEMDKLINRFGDYGMAVIVDNHQDLFSRQLCGEGVPHFYTPADVDHKCPFGIVGTFFRLAGRCVPLQSYNMETDDQGLPLLSECQKHSFEDMYTAPEVASAFSALYTNQDGLLDKMFAFWTEVAQRFKDNPNVIGYDILNEPWPANMYKDASLFFKPRKFDAEILYPVAQEAHSVVRAVDDDKAIFFEGAQFPDTQPFLGGKTLSLGFPDTPGGAEYANRQVLNDHTYCCQAAGSMCDEGEPPLEKNETCRKFHKQKVLKRAEDAQNYGVPLMFTEFGACFDGERCATEINNSADAFDLGLSSWAYWMYKSFGDFTTTGGTSEGMFNSDGTPQDLKLRAIARSYAHAFQGTPETMYFQTDNASFKTSWHLDEQIQGLTEVYLNEDLFYPEGARVTLTDCQDGIIDHEFTRIQKNYFTVAVSDSQEKGASDLKCLNVTPTVPAETQKTVTNEDGYFIGYTVKDLGEDVAVCHYSFELQGDSNFGPDIYIEQVTPPGETYRHKSGETKDEPCFWMQGGSTRLMKKRWPLPDQEIMEVPLPYLNGVSVQIVYGENATTSDAPLTSFFSKLASSILQ